MGETLGSLVDKLTIANVRLWHLEDIRRDRRFSDKKRLEAADKISIVNSERNDLMDEIDDFLYKAIKGKVRIRAPKMKIYKEFKLKKKSKPKKKTAAKKR